MSTTLIFPSSTQDAQTYCRRAIADGHEVVAASSLRYDESAADFETWIYLPPIHDPTFTDRFIAALEQHEVARIYSSAAAVQAHLQQLIEDLRLDVTLLTDSPVAQQLAAYRELQRKATAAESMIRAIAGDRSTLSPSDIAAMLRQAATIYGETSESKIVAMMGIFATAPKGDVVEVGSLMGKSAFVLAYLARHYDVGPVLTADPYDSGAAVQHDAPEVVRRLTAAWDFELLADSFLINLLPVAGPQFGHLRMRSADAYRHYATSRKVVTPGFGETEYSGRIAVIHIDGNHDYASVDEDCRLWLTRLTPYGWLILDDYVWLHDDGPRRVGDALLDRKAGQINCAFVCGQALFVQCR